MRVFLTGANGFIGSAITAELIAAGHQVTGAVRDPARFRRRFPTASAVAADLNQLTGIDDWTPLLADIDAVVNCAGVLQSRRGQKAQKIHADAPIALFRAACELGIRKIVQISAVSVGAATEYARTKLAADEELARLDCDWVILRPSLVYARDAYGGTAMLRAQSVMPFAIPVIADGGQLVTPIHTADLAQTVLIALTTGKMNRKIIAPCGPQTMPLGDLLQTYRSWFGLQPAPLIPIPMWIMRIAGRVGNVIGNGPITTTSLVQLEHGNAADSAEFAGISGLKPASVADVLARNPSGTAELWHARFYLLRPMVRLALVVLWAASSLTGLLATNSSILASPGMDVLGKDIALLLGRAASVFDLVIAAALTLSWAPRATLAAQLLAVTCYTIVLTVLSPNLWAELLGPLLKNIPILALILVNGILMEER